MSRFEIPKLIEEFRVAAIDKGDGATPAKLDHRLYDQMRQTALRMKAFGVDGELALRGLLKDESAYVRTWIAAALLVEGDASARPVLEEIAEMPGFTGSAARLTLEEFDKDNLKAPFWK